MYGCLEAADEVRSGAAGRPSPRAAIGPATRAPFLAVRGDTPCVLLEKGHPSPLFYDAGFWRRYVDTLARARFNTLDLQAGIDLESGELVNGLALFASPPEFPQAAREASEVRRNLAILRRIVALARDRAIRVILTNRALDSTIPPDRQGRYVAQAVARIRQAVPELWAVGHRPAADERLAAAVLSAYAGAVVGGRTRLPTPPPRAAGGRLAPLILARPFNGDQFGLPYSVDPAPESPLPANTVVVWQIGGGAAHRVLPFANVEMIRRAVRSCRSGRGAGLLIEPIGAYGPQEIGRALANAGQAAPFRYAFETHWMWYGLWGRLAYNPEAPQSTLWSQFHTRFGHDPGEFIYQVLQYAGCIVPRLYAFHSLGTGSRDQAPEFEIANRRDLAGGEGDIRDFLRVGPLDSQVMAGPLDWAERKVLRQPDPRAGPEAVAHELAWLSLRIRGDVATIDDLKPRSPVEWARLRTECLALARLGDHYANRISAAAHLALHQTTDDETELVLAQSRLTEARTAWGEVVQLTREHYPPLSEPLKLRTASFTWEEEGKRLERDVAAVAELRAAWDAERLRPRPVPRIAHIPAGRATPTRAYRVTATILAGDAPVEVTLHYTPPGETVARTLPMTRMYQAEAVYAARIPGTDLREGWLSYQIEASSQGAVAWWPAPEPQPERAIPVTADADPPQVEALTASVVRSGLPPTTAGGAQVHITARVKDLSGLKTVTLRFRSLAPGESWQTTPMTEGGGGYEATVALPSAGLAYRLDVVDPWGNAAMFPDFRKETPYRVVSGR
jgi:hypothetical protein